MEPETLENSDLRIIKNTESIKIALCKGKLYTFIGNTGKLDETNEDEITLLRQKIEYKIKNKK